MVERLQIKIGVFIFCVAFTLITITGLDYMVTGTPMFFVYPLGMPFEWLKLWWLLTGILFGAIACLASVSYLLLREETKRHKVTALLLGFTIFMQELSGNLDAVWFIIDAIQYGGKPWISWDTIWTWSPFYWGLNVNWTAKHQLIGTVVMNGILFLAWSIYGLYINNKLKRR